MPNATPTIQGPPIYSWRRSTRSSTESLSADGDSDVSSPAALKNPSQVSSFRSKEVAFRTQYRRQAPRPWLSMVFLASFAWSDMPRIIRQGKGWIRSAAAGATPAASMSIARNLRLILFTSATNAVDAATTLPDAIGPRCSDGGGEQIVSLP